jgi:hypothetical protein
VLKLSVLSSFWLCYTLNNWLTKKLKYETK